MVGAISLVDCEGERQHTNKQMLDFYHATEYLSKVAHAAHPEKTNGNNG